jgi:hypothetical protein
VTASDVNTELRTIRNMLTADISTDNILRHGEFDMAVACMDMIGDTQLAIDAFDRRPASEGQGHVEVYGQRYLEVHGLFQAIFLQQDGIRHLAAALNLSKIDVFKDPDLGDLRELRNKYFGHPSNYTPDRKKIPATYHGLTRVTVTRDEITAWTYTYPRFSTETISIKASIAKQAKGATRVLERLLHELDAKQKDYNHRVLDVPHSGA